MQDPRDAQRVFIVGATEQPEALEERLSPLNAEIDRVWDTEAEGGKVVMAHAPLRYADTVAEELGPNAQILEDESEAIRVAGEAATPPSGEPYEA